MPEYAVHFIASIVISLVFIAMYYAIGFARKEPEYLELETDHMISLGESEEQRLRRIRCEEYRDCNMFLGYAEPIITFVDVVNLAVKDGSLTIDMLLDKSIPNRTAKRIIAGLTESPSLLNAIKVADALHINVVDFYK